MRKALQWAYIAWFSLVRDGCKLVSDVNQL